MTIGNETSEPMAVTVVMVFKVPCVDRPSSDLYSQKKLLLTWSANSDPDAIASPTMTGATGKLPTFPGKDEAQFFHGLEHGNQFGVAAPLSGIVLCQDFGD